MNTLPRNFIMENGSVNLNTSKGSTNPHGGGGVYVAKGVFDMLNGQVINNIANRQGGGVFVWSRSFFLMDGNASVTANSGVGASKAICNRGITIMRGTAQADKVYIWNYASGSWNNGAGDAFTLMEGARMSGLVLAFADDPQNNRNYLNIVESDRLTPSGQFFSGADTVTTIDLDSHLESNGSFSISTIAGDWVDRHLLKNGNGNVIPDAVLARFILGSFASGGPNVSLHNHKLDTVGKLIAK
jgi:hypothetical protein